MKYMILLYNEPDVWPPEDHAVALKRSIEICHKLDADGSYVLAYPLQSPSSATSIRVREGKASLRDGPFAETKEHLAGFFLIDVGNLDEAIAIAKTLPGTERGTAEIRPVIEVAGLPQPRATNN